jgi:signal transduction histidine kinase
MTGPDAAILAAIISAVVAFLAIVGSVTTTWLNLRDQRKAEDKRREHERHMRCLNRR